jgi:hypothetical protein
MLCRDEHGGDVVIARVPIAKATDVRFIECVDELLLESFVRDVVFAPDTEVFFVLLDGFVDVGGSSASYNVGCCPGVYGSVEGDVG